MTSKNSITAWRQLKGQKEGYSPVYKYTTTRVKTFLYEGIGLGEVLNEIFIIDVVDLDDHMLIVSE